MIWNKFCASSQFMEKTLHEFDTDYQWSGNGPANQGQIGRPQRTANQPMAGLRDLYCFWIDQLLGQIETNGANWVRSATANYKASSYASDDAGKKWLNNVLKPNGLISESTMRFLRAASQHPKPNSQSPSIWAQSRYENLWRTGQGYGAAGPF
jgi:chitinase